MSKDEWINIQDIIMVPAQEEEDSSGRHDIFVIQESQLQEQAAEPRFLSWTANATRLLLDTYKKYKGKVGTSQIKNNKKLWEVIANEMKAVHGLSVTAGNCENRWRVLERNFKKHVDESKKTGRGRKEFEFAEQMFDILGKKKNIMPEVLLSATTTSLPPRTESPILILEPQPGPASVDITEKKTPSKPGLMKRKATKSTTLEEMRKDRKGYYEKRLKLEEQRLEIEPQKLEVSRQRTQLLKERNELLKTQQVQSKE